MSGSDLLQLAEQLINKPLMISQSALHAMMAVAEGRINLHLPSAIHDQNDSQSQEVSSSGGAIAVIDINGPLFSKSTPMTRAFGLADYQTISALLSKAVFDNSVDGIMLVIDSPGGLVKGLFDLGDDIKAAGELKPIRAHVDNATSAAYSIASSTSHITTSQTGAVGHIGVIMSHVDMSVMNANDGIKITHIFAGDKKVDGASDAPLSGSAKSDMQAEVDRIYGIFTAQVAENRGISQEEVKATEAGVFYGPNAVTAGLADKVSTLDEALREMSLSISNKTENQQFNPGASALGKVDGETMASTEETGKEPEKAPINPQPIAAAPVMAPVIPDNPQPMAMNAGSSPGFTEEELKNAVSAREGEIMEIMGTCGALGRPGMAAGFIKKGYNDEGVKMFFMNERAKSGGESITSAIMPGAATSDPDKPEDYENSAIAKLCAAHKPGGMQ